MSVAVVLDPPYSIDLSRAPGALPSILLVEECPHDLYLTRELLLDAGVRNPVVAVTDVGSAILLLERAVRDSLLPSPPVVMFADLKLACEDGIPLIRWVRSRRELDGMLIVVLSGSDDPELRKRALAAGADSYQGKFPEPVVLARIVAGATEGLRIAAA